MTHSRFWAAALPVFALVALTACSRGIPAPQTVGAASITVIPVKIATAELRSIPVEIKAIGNVEAFTTIAVKAQIGGALIKAHFKEGDSIRQGDALFEIDPRPYQESILQLEANLARDKALRTQAEAALARAEAQEAHFSKQTERYERLAAQGIFSRVQADEAALEARSRRTDVHAEKASIESFSAAIRADEAALGNARLNLGYCTIKSPITGHAGNVLVKEGNLVKANDVDLVTIRQVAPIYVTFAIPEDRLLALRELISRGDLTIGAGIPGDTRQPARGKVTFLDNSVDTATGTIHMKATFPNADAHLWPGQFVDVRVLLEERTNAIVIPAAAVQTGQSGNYVYVVKPDDTVEMRNITAGPRAGRIIAIDKGVQSGDRVVTEGHLRLAPGIKVRTAS